MESSDAQRSLGGYTGIRGKRHTLSFDELALDLFQAFHRNESGSFHESRNENQGVFSDSNKQAKHHWLILMRSVLCACKIVVDVLLLFLGKGIDMNSHCF